LKTLITFFIRFSAFFLFVFLEIIAVFLMSHNKGIQESALLNSSNNVIARMYEVSNNVVEFFKLSAANDNLSNENTALKNQIIELKNQLASVQPADIVTDSLTFKIAPEMQYSYISAKVINNTTDKVLNYITINKGGRDGIRPDMGVVSDLGVVGIVKDTSANFATIVPLLNPKFQLSCKFKRNNYVGLMRWSGLDYRYSNMLDIARHVDVKQGDTIVTSGLTMTFPEGIPVGKVNKVQISPSDAYFTIEVLLAVNFRTLSHVSAVDFKYAQEAKALKEKDEK
jgi:rod shape-determining protein MreC